jgi:hypothetical protein
MEAKLISFESPRKTGGGMDVRMAGDANRYEVRQVAMSALGNRDDVVHLKLERAIPAAHAAVTGAFCENLGHESVWDGHRSEG